MIGIFDSGSGGLTVLRELRRCAPMADVVYFGDLKNAPYGNKTREELGALTVMGLERLMKEGATELVSACNSVSVSIVLPMFEILSLPRAHIIEMVGPTVASLRGLDARVLVVATQATVESRVYQDGCAMVGIEARAVAAPTLVSLIESGASRDELEALIEGVLAPHVNEGFTHLIMGCTHYPLVQDAFDAVLARLEASVVLIDPAVPVAQTIAQRYDTNGTGVTKLITSEASAVFDRFARQALGVQNGHGAPDQP